MGIGSSGTHEKIATSLELSGLSDLFREFPVASAEDVAPRRGGDARIPFFTR